MARQLLQLEAALDRPFLPVQVNATRTSVQQMMEAQRWWHLLSEAMKLKVADALLVFDRRPLFAKPLDSCPILQDLLMLLRQLLFQLVPGKFRHSNQQRTHRLRAFFLLLLLHQHYNSTGHALTIVTVLAGVVSIAMGTHRRGKHTILTY